MGIIKFPYLRKTVPRLHLSPHSGYMNITVCPSGFATRLQRSSSLCSLLWEFHVSLVYLDDLLVYSATFSDHLVRLETVFKRLRDTGLKIKVEKLNFLQSEVKFLGHPVSAQGVSTDPDKVWLSSGQYPAPYRSSGHSWGSAVIIEGLLRVSLKLLVRCMK